MAAIIEHDKRKHEILQRALDVFMDEGYEDVTFQKIADRCGITRTTLYIYFKNKREIFLWSIKELTSNLELVLVEYIEDPELSSPEKLRRIMIAILDCCKDNKKLFNVLLSYLIQLQKTGVDVNERVRRRVIRLRHLLTTTIIEGEKKGEIKVRSVKDANEMLYGLIESAIFRLAMLRQDDIEEGYGAIEVAIDGLKTKD